MDEDTPSTGDARMGLDDEGDYRPGATRPLLVNAIVFFAVLLGIALVSHALATRVGRTLAVLIGMIGVIVALVVFKLRERRLVGEWRRVSHAAGEEPTGPGVAPPRETGSVWAFLQRWVPAHRRVSTVLALLLMLVVVVGSIALLVSSSRSAAAARGDDPGVVVTLDLLLVAVVACAVGLATWWKWRARSRRRRDGGSAIG